MRTLGLFFGIALLALGTLQFVMNGQSTVIIAGAILHAGSTIAEAITNGARRKEVI